MVSYHLFPYFRHYPDPPRQVLVIGHWGQLLKLGSQSVSLPLNLLPHVFQRNRPVEDKLTTLGVGVEGEVGETHTSTPRSLATPRARRWVTPLKRWLTDNVLGGER